MLLVRPVARWLQPVRNAGRWQRRAGTRDSRREGSSQMLKQVQHGARQAIKERAATRTAVNDGEAPLTRLPRSWGPRRAEFSHDLPN